MSADQGADERRIRTLLRRIGVGPDALPPPPPPLVEITVQPPYDTQEADGQAREPYDEVEQPAPAPSRPWYSFGRDTPAAVPEQQTVLGPGGVHVTINPPTPVAAPADEDERAAQRRRRRLRLLAYFGSAGGAGYYAGLGSSMGAFLADTGNGAPAAGIALIAMTAIPAAYVPHLRAIPPPLRPLATWLCLIPSSTAAIALVLNAPNALI
ncbi:hypothetical protein [Streptomyces liangshanensis]|uniref:hypothetical protein n=1 Tax=Streptomyces liangshanensis TaxID=2717324 RepID=UPI0036DB5085